jgi:general secretion pathway protein A
MNLAVGYCDFFALECVPFSIAPDPGFLYPSLPHREALAHLGYGLEREGGFILLTGEVGTGKTTLTRLLLQQLPAGIDVAYILNTQLEVPELLASICGELRVPLPAQPGLKACVDALNEALLSRHAEGRRVLLVIEEAQALGAGVLEFLRLLTNLETNTAKLLHILLVGQPELLELIRSHALRQLDQRIVARYHLRPLQPAETRQYVDYRLKRAGARQALFSAHALATLHRSSGGVPRLINLVAERCLVGAFAAGQHRISAALVRTAAREVLGREPARLPLHWRTAALAAALVAALGLAVRWHWPAPAIAGPQAAAAPTTLASANPEPVTTMPPSPDTGGGVNAATAMLHLWQIPGQAANSTEMCLRAEAAAMRCLRLQDRDLDTLRRLDRPVLIELQDGPDLRRSVMLAALDSTTAITRDSSGEHRLQLAELDTRWDGELLLLWREPPGFSGALTEGERNRALLDWTQDALDAWQPGRSRVIDDGVYATVLGAEVRAFQSAHGLRADGVIGLDTSLVLARYADDVPRLSSPAETH